MIRTKSVYSPIDRKKDGLRILVTRLWPRGLTRNRCDAWMPNLGPSQGLLDEFRKTPMSATAFYRRYKKELFETGAIDRRNKVIKNRGQKYTLRLLKALGKRQTITLMCSCEEDAEECHRYELHRVLSGKI